MKAGKLLQRLDPKREVMQTKVVLSIERYAALRLLNLPKRDPRLTIRDKCRWVAGISADHLPAQTVAKEAPCRFEFEHGQAHVIDTDCRL